MDSKHGRPVLIGKIRPFKVTPGRSEVRPGMLVMRKLPSVPPYRYAGSIERNKPLRLPQAESAACGAPNLASWGSWRLNDVIFSGN